MPRMSGQEILAHRFPRRGRSGYDTVAVDQFLHDVASVVDELQQELDGNTQGPHAARLLIENASRVADETMVGATLWSDEQRGIATEEARRLVQNAWAEADSLMAQAQARAEETITTYQEQLASLEQQISQRQAEWDRLLEQEAALVNEWAERHRPREPGPVDATDTTTIDTETEGYADLRTDNTEVAEQRAEM